MFKQVFQLIEYNLKRFLLFQLVYRLLSVIIFSPIFIKIFQYIMKIAGYSYLTLDNIGGFICNPLVMIIFICFIFLLTIYEMFHICTNIIILDASYQKKKVRIRDVLPLSFQKSFQIFRMNNLKISFLVLFLIPFLHIGIASNFITTISIPEFILDYIQQNIFLTMMFIIILVFFVFIFLRWIYSLYYYVLEDCDFKESCYKSQELSRHHLMKDFCFLTGSQLIINIIYMCFLGVEIGLVYMFHHFLEKYLLTKSLILTCIVLLVAITYTVFVLLSVSVSYAIMSTLFYQHKNEMNEDMKHIHFIKSEFMIKKKKVYKVLLIVFIVIGGTYYTYGVLNGRFNLNIEYVRKTEVTAHRGASLFYPENTMSAFYGAKEQGAQWIELDVQQTKDQQIIVFHDLNLKRITGVNCYVRDMEYKDIRLLDAGKSFGKEYAGEYIPLLEEVIDFAKENNIRLNIELKPSGYEKDFEKQVIEIIEDKEFEKQCVLTSLNYQVLQNIKKISPQMTTVYVMSFAYGNITQLDAADCFSIEATSISQKIVSEVHNAGKEIYAWTVNNEENISKMTQLNVDNIVTDDVLLTKRLIIESQTSNIIIEFMRFIEKYL